MLNVNTMQKMITSLIPTWLLNTQVYTLVVTDFDGNYLFVNEVFKKVFSFVTPNFIGKHFSTTVHPEDVGKYIDASIRCRTHTLQSVSVEVRKIKNKKGDFFWTECEFFLLKDEDGTPVGTIHIGHDIKEEIVREKLQHSENKLRAILDSTKDSNILLSPDFKILSINNTAKQNIRKSFGKEATEGQDFLQYVVKGSESDFKINFHDALFGEYLQKEREIFFEHEKSVWFEFSYFPSYDNSGRIIGVAFNVANIDSRKQAEEKLRQSEYILKAIYHSSSESSTLISPSYKVLHFNKVAAEMSQEIFGKYPKIGDDYANYLLPYLQEEVKSCFNRALEGETIQIETTSNISWYRLIFFPVYDQEGKLAGVAVNIKDITGRKQNELRIANQNEKLRAIAWQQSHGVRRPLANILGLINLIRTEKDENNLPAYMNFLQVAADELDKIIHEIVRQTINTGEF
ncbi:MAG: PAS domain S-box protein [Cytophagales bacterium]|nr:MAG: PAS domain S-box protein [Cytophagales bacterium]